MDIDFAEELSIWGAQAEGDADALPTSNALPMVIPHDFWVMLCKAKFDATGLQDNLWQPQHLQTPCCHPGLLMLAGRHYCLRYEYCRLKMIWMLLCR